MLGAIRSHLMFGSDGLYIVNGGPTKVRYLPDANGSERALIGIVLVGGVI
jgi:hypothetical protein